MGPLRCFEYPLGRKTACPTDKTVGQRGWEEDISLSCSSMVGSFTKAPGQIPVSSQGRELSSMPWPEDTAEWEQPVMHTLCQEGKCYAHVGAQLPAAARNLLPLTPPSWQIWWFGFALFLPLILACVFGEHFCFKASLLGNWHAFRFN